MRAARRRVETLENELEETQQGLNALSLELEERVENRTAELKRIKEDFKSIIENASEGIFRISEDGKSFILANPALASILGYDSVEQLTSRISNIPQQLSYNSEKYWNILEKARREGEVVGVELPVLTENEAKVWLRTSLRKVCEDGNFRYYEGIVEDITEERQHRERLIALHESLDLLQDAESKEEAYRAALFSARDFLDLENLIIYEFVDETLKPVTMTAGIDPDRFEELNTENSVAGETFRGEETISGQMDEISSVKASCDKYDSIISVPVGDRGVFQTFSNNGDSFNENDVRLVELLARHLKQELERINMQRRLSDLARRDPLTGLYNRYYLEEAVEKEIERSKRYEHTLTFLMIDINGFKKINDRYGHAAGDQILAAVADLIVDNVRDADTVIRYGGDEFLVMMPETGEEAEKAAQRIKSCVREWSRNKDRLNGKVSLAVGQCSWYPNGERKIDEVISIADHRMYGDKWTDKEKANS